MKCSYCNKKITGPAILITCDGDFVCDEKCKAGYEADRDRFFTFIVNSEEKTKQWLTGGLDETM